jgi:arsenate reductase
MAQFWAHYLAEHYGLAIFAYSGGTEVTSLAPQAAKAMEDLGFEFDIQKGNQSNPIYRLKFDSAKRELILYSKLFTEITDSLPAFASLMCCSQAEETCPYVPGTELRIALNYEDPKHADGTESEAAAYHECLMKIGSEINYIFSKVAKRIK